MLRQAIEKPARRLTQRVLAYVGGRHVAVDLLSRRDGRRLHCAREGLQPACSFDMALAALGTALQALEAETGLPRGMTCDVVIADRWLLYDVVAIDAVELSAAAAQAAVTAMLADLGGTDADALSVRWQWQRDGHSALAMGIPSGWLNRVREMAAERAVSIRSVTGEFIGAYNGRRDELRGSRVVFAVSRAGAAQIALLANGIVRATAYVSDCSDAAALMRCAAGELRARGEDTSIAADYVVDHGGARQAFETPAGGAERWFIHRAPDWASVA